MAGKIDLKEIEKRSYRSYFKTGIYDLGFGVLLLSFAVAPLVREAIGMLYIIFAVIPGPLVIVLGKKYLTDPRMGFVRFGEKRKSAKRNMRRISAMSTTFLVALLALTVAGIFPGFIAESLGGAMFMAIIGAIVFMFMALIAYLMDFINMLYYGIVIGVGIVTAEILHGIIGNPLDSVITFGILGSLLLILGIFNTRRFLKKYPKPRMKFEV
jgi:hypothetical protein